MFDWKMIQLLNKDLNTPSTLEDAIDLMIDSEVEVDVEDHTPPHLITLQQKDEEESEEEAQDEENYLNSKSMSQQEQNEQQSQQTVQEPV